MSASKGDRSSGRAAGDGKAKLDCPRQRREVLFENAGASSAYSATKNAATSASRPGGVEPDDALP